jgi:hypothetical protein
VGEHRPVTAHQRGRGERRRRQHEGSGGISDPACRLTIPGRFDVAGASLLGMPFVQIGHTADAAWTHTVSTPVTSRGVIFSGLPSTR